MCTVYFTLAAKATTAYEAVSFSGSQSTAKSKA